MELRELSVGRWPHIHNSLGIDARFLRNRHMPCPGCGGSDRWRYDDKEGRGTFFCGGGGEPISGDGFDLLSHVYGWDFKTAANEVRRVLGIDSSDRAQPQQIRPQTVVSPPQLSKTQPYALELWEACNRDDDHVASHPYAIKKRITGASGVGRGLANGSLVGKESDCLIVPQRTLEGELIGVECINADGIKQSFGKKGILLLGNDLDSEIPMVVFEGWASAVGWLDMNDWHGCAVASFGKGTAMRKVAMLQEKYPDHVVLAGEEQDD